MRSFLFAGDSRDPPRGYKSAEATTQRSEAGLAVAQAALLFGCREARRTVRPSSELWRSFIDAARFERLASSAMIPRTSSVRMRATSIFLLSPLTTLSKTAKGDRAE